MDVEHVADAEGAALLPTRCERPRRRVSAAPIARALVAGALVAGAVAVLIGCGASVPHDPAAPPPIAVAVVGSPSTRAPLGEAIAEVRPSEEVRLRRVELPADVEPSVPDAAAARASEAHRALVEADAPRCLELLEGEELVTGSLAEGRRGTAARVLLGRLACHVALGNDPAARQQARAMAAFGLELPEGGASPAAEVILAEVAAELAGAPVHRLEVRAGDLRASVSLDGAAPACATPCTLSVRPGDHVLRLAADGREPAVRRIAVSRAVTIDQPLAVASPARAARQWNTRYAESPAPDTPESVALLATALRARTLVVLTSTPAGTDARLVRGSLVREGALAFRSEHRVEEGADFTPQVEDLVRELLVSGGVIEEASILESPWFWITTAAAAAAASVVTYAILVEPDTRVEARFR